MMKDVARQAERGDVAHHVQRRAHRQHPRADGYCKRGPSDPTAPGEKDRHGDENEQWDAYVGTLLRAIACEMEGGGPPMSGTAGASAW